MIFSAFAIHLPAPSAGRFGHISGERTLYPTDLSKVGKDENVKNEQISIVAAHKSSLKSLISFVELTANAAATSAVSVTDQLTYMQTMTAGLTILRTAP